MKKMITGSCFCNAVQYRITSAIQLAVNCHCNSCKKAGGAASSSLASFQLGEQVVKHFCRHCGAAIFNRNRRYPGRCMVAIGSLDDPTVATPTVNIHCKEQLPWVKLDEKMQNFEQDYS